MSNTDKMKVCTTQSNILNMEPSFTFNRESDLKVRTSSFQEGRLTRFGVMARRIVLRAGLGIKKISGLQTDVNSIGIPMLP